MKNPKNVATLRLYNNEQLPSWYRWDLHIGLNALIFIASLSLNLALRPFSLGFSLLLIPVFFTIWSIIEYGIHRFLLHGSLFSHTHFYKQHSLFHHGYFTDDSMKATERVDTNRILLYSSDLFILIIFNGLMSYLATRLFNAEIGSLFFTSGILYLITYEVVHGICHLKLKIHNSFVRKVIEHHRQHHSPALMKKCNFSVVIPALDSVLSSSYKPERGE